jgi:hypothetical protein
MDTRLALTAVIDGITNLSAPFSGLRVCVRDKTDVWFRPADRFAFQRKILAARAAAFARPPSRELRRRSGARNSFPHSRQRNFLLFVRRIIIRSNPVGCLISKLFE